MRDEVVAESRSGIQVTQKMEKDLAIVMLEAARKLVTTKWGFRDEDFAFARDTSKDMLVDCFINNFIGCLTI